MTIRSGATGVDFSFAKPPAARLVELGHGFVVGYLSDPPASPTKNITLSQCDEYSAAGLEVLLVWEMTAVRASLGAMVGASDGRRAALMARERNYPTYKPILAADDTNTTTANLDAQEAYMRAFAQACAPYRMGIYGDVDILERCAGLWQIGWVPNAWAWSGVSRSDAEARALAVGAHVLQHKGFYIDNIWAVDPNVVIRDFPAWETTAPVNAPPTIPNPTNEVEMSYYRDDRAEGWQIWWVGRDWKDALYAYPISDTPRQGDWDLLDALGVVPTLATFSALVAIMDRQNRPTPLPVADLAALTAGLFNAKADIGALMAIVTVLQDRPATFVKHHHEGGPTGEAIAA